MQTNRCSSFWTERRFLFYIADEGLTVRNHTSYIVKFDYVDTLAQAGRLVGCEVLFEKELLEGQEPEESGYDIFELIGFEVKDQVSEETGEVADVADYSGNVVLTVSIMNKEILFTLFRKLYLQDRLRA